ncbi:MAG: response regulator [Desulfobacterales bacterium]|nr:response regulator [Desulfobacterales bacterium]
MDKKIKVLMVDDEEQFRETTNKILKKRGFDTILAANGEEAIKKLVENPDVVILDVKMPGMDGHQALKEIKKLKPFLPVIMLTGHGALPSAKDALIEGAFDYLTKPCDISLLATKIYDACQQDKKVADKDEKTVADAMIHIEHYTTITGEQLIKDAFIKLKESFTSKISTSKLMETGHRSILVLDNNGNPEGILSIKDLFEKMMPIYLKAPKPSLADAIQFSPMFWKGLFTIETKKLAKMKVKDVMSDLLLTIDGESNLMEAAHMMVNNNIRRLVVTKGGKTIGVIREQDLFFEMEKIIRKL